MTSYLRQPQEFVLKYWLIRIGLTISVLVFGFTIIDLFPSYAKGSLQVADMPVGTLVFWGTWILIFALLKHFVIPKPHLPPESQKIKKQNSLYLAAVMILGILDLGITVIIMQKFNSGSDEGILPLMILWLVIAMISMVVLIRYFIFIMDNKEKTRKATAADGPISPQQEPALKEKDR